MGYSSFRYWVEYNILKPSTSPVPLKDISSTHLEEQDPTPRFQTRTLITLATSKPEFPVLWSYSNLPRPQQRGCLWVNVNFSHWALKLYLNNSRLLSPCLPIFSDCEQSPLSIRLPWIYLLREAVSPEPPSSQPMIALLEGGEWGGIVHSSPFKK